MGFLLDAIVRLGVFVVIYVVPVLVGAILGLIMKNYVVSAVGTLLTFVVTVRLITMGLEEFNPGEVDDD